MNRKVEERQIYSTDRMVASCLLVAIWIEPVDKETEGKMDVAGGWSRKWNAIRSYEAPNTRSIYDVAP